MCPGFYVSLFCLLCSILLHLLWDFQQELWINKTASSEEGMCIQCTIKKRKGGQVVLNCENTFIEVFNTVNQLKLLTP